MAYSQIIPSERTYTVTYDSGTTSFVFSSTPDLKYGQTYKFIINSDAGVRFIFSSASTDPLTNYISDGIYYTPEAVENTFGDTVNAETYGIDSGTIILTVGHDVVSPIYYGDPDNWSNTNDSLALSYEQLVIDRGNTFEEWRVKTNVLSDKFGDFSSIDNAYTGDDVVSALNEIQTAASSDKLGLVKIGYTENGKNYPVELSSEKMFVNVPWTDTTYSNFTKATASTAGNAGLVPAPAAGDQASKYLKADGTWTVPPDTTYSTATNTTLGLVKLGSGTTQSKTAQAVSDTDNRTYAIQKNSSGQLLVNVPWTNTTYSTATNSTLGLVKLGSDTQQTVAAQAVSSTASRTYAIQKNSSGQLLVNVPWTNTTYAAGTGLSLSGTSFSVTLAPKLTNSTYTFQIASNKWTSSTNVVAPDFEATSDRKVKENFRPLENALDLINQVKIHKYNLKSTGAEGIGVIAQELQEIIPEAVVEGETMSVHYNYLFSVLVQAVQELSKKVENGSSN